MLHVAVAVSLGPAVHVQIAKSLVAPAGGKTTDYNSHRSLQQVGTLTFVRMLACYKVCTQNHHFIFHLIVCELNTRTSNKQHGLA